MRRKKKKLKNKPDLPISEIVAIVFSFVDGEVEHRTIRSETEKIKESETHTTASFIYDCSRTKFSYFSENFEIIFKNKVLPFYTDGLLYLERLCFTNDIDPLFKTIAYFLDLVRREYPNEQQYCTLDIQFRITKSNTENYWAQMEVSPAAIIKDGEFALLKGTITNLTELKNDSLISARFRVKDKIFKLDPLKFSQVKGPLSEREIEVLTLLKEGLISKQISGKLNITTHTVNNHRKNIIRKLKVHSIVEALKIAEEIGVLLKT